MAVDRKALCFQHLKQKIMEVKKSPKADLEKTKGLFLKVGLVVAMAIMLVAFEWGSKDFKVEVLDFAENVITEEEIINTEHEEPPPPEQPPVAVLSDVLIVVDDNIRLDMNLDLFDEDFGAEIVFRVWDDVPQEAAVEEDIPFTAVEEPAGFSYNGRTGVDAFRMWVSDNMNYPVAAVENNIQGRVIMSFVVNTDGRVVNVRVLRGVDPLVDREAIRVIESSPRWTPGRQRNQPVRVAYTLPVIFQLQ